jgi:MHS family proline/betaine transporter-like MFS transporter
VVLTGGGFYLLFVWWPTYLTEVVSPPVPHALLLNTLSMLVLTATIPVAGWLSDFVGRRRVLLTSAAAVGIAAVPLFAIASTGTLAAALGAQICFAVLMAGISGPIPAAMVELFPTRLRYSGVALGYNISLAVFGGTAPLMATLLVTRTGHLLAPACYLAFLAAVSLVACTAVHQFPHRNLRAQHGFETRRSAFAGQEWTHDSPLRTVPGSMP